MRSQKLSEDKIKDIILKRERRVPGFTVITKWGKQLSYQIDDIAFDKSPKSYRFLVKDQVTREEKEMSLIEYFKWRYPTD